MRLKSAILCSASAAVLALGASPAAAQGTTDPNAGAQETPADQASPQGDAAQAPATEEAGAEGDTIVVTGLRRSLESAQGVKRNSVQIVDAIVAEDIGKLPDIAVSDTAARIPGIQVQRSGGEANTVLLRGLDETFYTTTYNGREIFTAERRSVALQDFPAGGVSAIEAFKTSTANLVEPGLSGLLNVRARRPFDFRGFEIAGSVWGNYPKQSEDFSPNAQLLISNRWNVGGGEIGALINFSYNRLHYQDSVRRHGFFIADLAGGRSPDWPEIHYNQADRIRPSINGSIQWRPSPGLEFYLEGLWQGYREHVSDNMWAQPLWGGASYSNIVKDGNNILSGTVTRPTACCSSTETWGFQGATKRKTDTYQFAVGGSYDAGPLRITADLARTSSTFKLRTESVDYELNTNNFSVDWFTGPIGGPGPTFQVNGIDPSNPAIYNYRGFFEDYATPKGKDWQARLDFEYEPGISQLPKIQWGVRFVDRDASNTAGAFYWNQRGRNIPFSAVPLDYQLFHPAFRGDKHKPFPLTWLAPTFNSVWDNLTKLRQFNIALCNCGSADGPPVDSARTFNINEKSYAGYLQASYEFDLGGGMTADGAIGLRAVKTEEHLTGFLPTAGAPQALNYTNSYTDWLPNANLRIRFTPQLQLRLAATETRTRPTFQQLRPSITLDGPPGCPASQPGCIRTGNSGNPALKPLTSRNYDASLEYYFSRTGFASAAVFRRDMRGFIANTQVQFPSPDPATGLPLFISRPFNTDKGRIQGFEAQLSTFFDFGGVPDWLKRFGLQANATYIDTSADFPLFCTPNQPGCQTSPGFTNATVVRLRLPDVSKWTYNLVGMYEGGGLTLRLAYNLRTGYPEGALSQRDTGATAGQTSYTLQGRAHAISRLDWSSSYAFNDNVTLFFDWTNILGKPFRSDIIRVNYRGGSPTGVEGFPMVVRFEETVFTGGVRFRF
ncbi:MAG: TonB-dependent receptor [Alphaproteobacteria bacterium]|nr:TonB-dependent receptor [Alphaproteobacteria bacterium]MBV9372349.1 TonB-dependent receptor [Alphaproteobacteria bacterium]MBV9899641.1 TonB-dependent receptor [Alphaproteobacteria bacterium]